MANYDYVFKAGDQLPEFTAVLQDANGVVDLTGAAGVKFIMRQVSGATPVINAAAAVVDAAAGSVKYACTSGDAAAIVAAGTPDTYYVEWQVTWTSGSKPQTFPNDGYQIAKVEAQLGS